MIIKYNLRHCEPPKGAWQSWFLKAGLLRHSFRVPRNDNFLIIFWLGIFLFAASSSLYAANSVSDVLGRIPVQSNGRVKPFESFARETLLNLTGKTSYEQVDATTLVWQWMATPEKWFSTPFLPVSFKPLQQEFSLMLIRKSISPQIILDHKPFLDKVELATAKRRKKETLSILEQKRLELYEHALLFQEIATGAAPGWIAHPEDPRVGWLPFQGFGNEEGRKTLAQFYPEEKVTRAGEALRQLLGVLKADPDSASAVSAAQDFSEALSRLLDSRSIFLDADILNKEIFYNHMHAFGWAWKFYLAAAGILLFLILSEKIMAKILLQQAWLASTIGGVGLFFFLAAFGTHFYGFYLRCVIAGRPPVTNMYESLIWVSWAVALFSLILFSIYRAWMILVVSSLVASFALMIAQAFPAVLDPSISPLVPVLRSNMWLTIHVLTITMSYGAFALAWGLGHGVIFNFAFFPQKVLTQRVWSQYLYRALQIGVILLASGTVLGGVWANYSWGRFWGWDPKETWALIALLGYLTVLHGRFAGWLDTFGLAVGSVVAFLGVVMAWYGVNFVLAAGLHSYGFGGGGAPYVTAIALLDLLLIGGCAAIYKQRMKKQKSFSFSSISDQIHHSNNQ